MEIGDQELRSLGLHLALARARRGLSQSELAKRCGLAQAQISYFELGRRLPTLNQILRLAKALDVSLQRLLSGADRPGDAPRDITVELRRLGIGDLWVADASVPGAFRRPEEVIAMAVSGHEPDPRIVEAIPAVLAWNELKPALLRAYGITTRTTFRLAWLADIALTIERQKGFPGGCRKEPLERFLKAAYPLHKRRPEGEAWDGLGRPMSGVPLSPVWKRWKINYAATIDQFEERARDLEGLRDQSMTLDAKTHLQLLSALAAAIGVPGERTPPPIAGPSKRRDHGK
jgi:transcriptional regulator with XRE-family HTH domain